MAFPSSPSDGQIYKNYKYNSTKGAWIYEPYTSKITRTKYNITDSNDVTVDLPDATNEVVERTYFRTGSGSGKVLFSAYGSQTINGDSASVWYLEGEGIIKLVPAGGNWQVVEYNDKGSNSNGEWHKYIDGTLRQYGIGDDITTSISIGNVYRNNRGITFPLAFYTTTGLVVICTPKETGNYILSISVYGLSTTSFTAIVFGVLSNSHGEIHWEAIGKWK